MVKIIWLIGLLPVTTGIGHIIAGLLIRPQREQPPQQSIRLFRHHRLTDRPLTNPIPSASPITLLTFSNQNRQQKSTKMILRLSFAFLCR